VAHQGAVEVQLEGPRLRCHHAHFGLGKLGQEAK
jgi:hypothetical protein